MFKLGKITKKSVEKYEECKLLISQNFTLISLPKAISVLIASPLRKKNFVSTFRANGFEFSF